MDIWPLLCSPFLWQHFPPLETQSLSWFRKMALALGDVGSASCWTHLALPSLGTWQAVSCLLGHLYHMQLGSVCQSTTGHLGSLHGGADVSSTGASSIYLR